MRIRNPFPNWTVWGPHGLDSVPEEYRGLFRWVLPLTDLFFIWFGVIGFLNGVGTVAAASSPGWQTWWSAMIAVAALVAGVGVALPRCWRIELAGKLPLVGLVWVYIAVFIQRGLQDPLVLATAGLICILILTPTWRLFGLSRQWRQHRIDQQALREAGALELPL